MKYDVLRKRKTEEIATPQSDDGFFDSMTGTNEISLERERERKRIKIRDFQMDLVVEIASQSKTY